MTGAREFFAHAREFSFGITDRFVPLNNRINRSFALRVEFGNMITGNAKLARKPLTLAQSFCMLSGCALTLTCQTFSLLGQPLERAFELTGNFPQSFSNGCL